MLKLDYLPKGLSLLRPKLAQIYYSDLGNNLIGLGDLVTRGLKMLIIHPFSQTWRY